MDEQNKVNINWEKDNQGNLIPEIDNKQACLRCNRRPALSDGSDEGTYYCKECIIIRNKIDKIKFREYNEKPAPLDIWGKNNKLDPDDD